MRAARDGLGGVFLLLAATAAHAVPCADARLQQRADAIALLREDLRQLRSEDPDDVPEAAQRGLAALKDQLTGLVAETMACAPLDDDAALAARLAAWVPAVAAGDVRVEHDFQHGVFGSPIGFRIDRIAGTPARLAVVTTVGLTCGDDDLLAVFEPERDQWQERLRWRSAPYERLDGAAGGLQVALSPRAADGGWHALVAAVGPACYSTWSTLAVAVLRPGPTPDTPRSLADRHASTWWGNGPPEVAASADGVSVRYWGGSIDRTIYSRRHGLAGRFEGDRLRLAATAESDQDRVEEWLAADDGAAVPSAATSSAAQRAALRDGFAEGTLAFGANRSCPDGATEVAIVRDDGTAAGFVAVGAEGRERRVIGSTTAAAAACDRSLPATDTAVWK